jgi:hypothetical protein
VMCLEACLNLVMCSGARVMSTNQWFVFTFNKVTCLKACFILVICLGVHLMLVTCSGARLSLVMCMDYTQTDCQV